jgi:hypothetical protein
LHVTNPSSELIAGEFKTQGERDRLQSAVSYYFDSPWVPQIHTLALVVDGLLIGLALLWLVTPLKRLGQVGMPIVAAAGLVLCWAEVLYAQRLQEGAVYVLLQMPFRPVNNVGVIGAQVFGTYLILRSPSGRLVGWRAWLVKAGLALGFWFFQAAVWQMVALR